jgi:hypothetical protein
MTYKFTLRFDNKKHSLTKDFGIPILDLGELLTSLYPIVKTRDDENITLTEIRGNCYAIDFLTEEEETKTRFLKVHKNIKDSDIESLRPQEQIYAYKLEKYIIKKGLYVESLDPTSKERAIRIDTLQSPKKIESFQSTKSIYGIISEIGGANIEDVPHIIVSGEPYKITISPEQEDSLKHNYKNRKLMLKIQVKRLLKDGKISTAKLISFKDLGERRLDEAIKELSKSDVSFFTDIDSDEFNNLLRNRE